MLFIKLLNRTSYALCLLAIVFAAGGSIWGVWTPNADGVVWRSVTTALIICAAAIAIIAVNGVLGVRMVREADLEGWLIANPNKANADTLQKPQ